MDSKHEKEKDDNDSRASIPNHHNGYNNRKYTNNVQENKTNIISTKAKKGIGKTNHKKMLNFSQKGSILRRRYWIRERSRRI